MKNKIKKQILKKLCLNKELTKSEKDLLKKYKLSGGGSIGIISKVCRYCKKELSEENFEFSTTYWSPMLAPCCNNNACKESGEKQEAYECQNIDKNCNECKYFERIEFSSNIIAQTANIFGNIGCYIGECKQKKIKVGANRNIFQGMDCFVHRYNKK